jgi:hypothetical protein
MMTGLVRKATLLSVCGLLVAGVAMAGVPDPGHSVIGTGINLVGTTGGVADAHGQKLIVVKDAGGTPVQNSTVTINFTACTGQDIRLCSTQPFAGVGVSCANKEVVVLTDASGTATFRVLGFALNPGGATNPNPPAPGFGSGGATVKADGVLLGTLNVGAYDQNGTAGCSSVDLALVANDKFSFAWSGGGPASFRGRSDLDGNNLITSVDLALAATVKFAASSTVSCASACP